MTFDDFIGVAFRYARNHPEQRFGQACMNALRWCNEWVYHKVSTDIWEIDAYNHRAVFAWFTEVEQLWN